MRLLVSSERVPLDEPVSIRLEDLVPGVRVTVRALHAGYIGQTWAS